MVRVSLKCLVNLRVKDIMWWGNGRYNMQPANKRLREDKNKLDRRVFECEYALMESDVRLDQLTPESPWNLCAQ